MHETPIDDAALEGAAITETPTAVVVAPAQALPAITEDPVTAERAAIGAVDAEIEQALAGYLLPLAFKPVGITLVEADLSALHAAGDDASDELKCRAAASRDWLARVTSGAVVLTDHAGKPLPMNPTPGL